jgi:hypothetical protein
MSTRLLPDWLDGWMEYTSNSEPPDSFRLWTGISTLAAAMQRKCFTQFGTLVFHCNFYVVLVGPAATRKGTAMHFAEDMLRELGIRLAADATTRQALIRRFKEATNTHIDPETNTPTFHSSTTIISKEFTVFLGYHDMDLIANLCAWFDCDNRWTYDTKNQGTDEIMGMWVNILGGTTPDLLKKSLPSEVIGSGLTSRIIFVYENKKGKSVALPFLSAEQERIKEKLQSDLEKISMLSGKFKFTEKFIEQYVEWYNKLDTESPAISDPRFEHYLGRRPRHLMALCMTLCVSRTDTMIISEQDMNKALSILESTEARMPEVFSGVGESPMASIVARIVKYLKMKQEVLYDELLSFFYQDIDDFNMRKILQTLEKMRWIKVTIRGENPDKILFIGNPKDGESND